MSPRVAISAAIACGLGSAETSSGGGSWVQFVDDTATRLIADPSLGADDLAEKDYAWGDVDHDGDIDLIVVRKQPFTTTGRRANVLFLNEAGVLVDRTAQYASASDVPGDEGLLTPTNDRDVILVDVNNDGWLDIVTAVTLTDNEPKHISHPRVYINLGEMEGVWLGFRYEDSRIPQMHRIAGPRFNAVAAGDVTGDGYPDLYFTDSDGGGQIFDFNDRLLINDGNGSFADETEARVPPWLTNGLFGAHAVIADLNHDGHNDILKVDAIGPHDLRLAYNDPNNVGIFTEAKGEIISGCCALYVTTGDLNNDELLDMVLTTDGTDRYFLNQGNGPDGHADFLELIFSASTIGFGGNSVVADLNNDGWKDVLIADVEIDIPGCSRTTDILRNNADPPNVMFTADPGNIPDDMLQGVHDLAVFDINGDGWLDLVIGRCTGTQVWINQPSCPADLNGNGSVGILDLLALLAAWGDCPVEGECSADLNGDGMVGILDLLTLLANWGLCA